jgi:uncharacterized protein (TIGR02246 family)
MTVLPNLLDAWQQAIDGHHPERVADLFTEDAVFQGLHPYSIGRAGVKEYYAAQPAGMTVAYRIRQTRQLADDVVLGWVAADFTFVDRPPIAVDLTVVARRVDGAWRIAHYHVSPRIPAKEGTPS